MIPNRSRTNVATQACETCRRRKSRCDETKPKCSSCQRLNLECNYRDTPTISTAKEDASTRILATLTRMEGKIDNLSLNTGGGGGSSSSSGISKASVTQHRPHSAYSDSYSSKEPAIGIDPSDNIPYLTAPHRTVVWPQVLARLTSAVPEAASRLAALSEGGTSWLITREMSEFQSRLPVNVDLPARDMEPDRSHASSASGTSFPTLTAERISTYTDAYFNTFNVAYPILDERSFMRDTLPPVLSTGFVNGDAASVLTLFVLALGQLATESLNGDPVEFIDGVPSGICGGSATVPPGIAMFNEARARIGLLVLRGDVISVQILVLQATYFEANACHIEYWRSIVQASMICQVLIQNPGVSWSTSGGDLIRRTFWACVLDEDLYHIDLDLPRTTIGDVASTVQLPGFTREASPVSERGSGFQDQILLEFYFLAKISLQRLILSVHDAIIFYSSRFEKVKDYSGPPIHVIQELTRQLEDWRAQLPRALRWSDDDLLNISSTDPRGERTADMLAETGGVEANSPLTRAGAEILAAELRARFYYARFMMGRPYIFKALHFPELMNRQDAGYCALAIQAACLLPIALGPTRQKKRLLPHLFTWTQSFIAILLILWVSKRDDCLSQIREEKLDETFVQEATQHMLHWIRDVKQIDGIAKWSWHFLEPLYDELSEQVMTDADSTI